MRRTTRTRAAQARRARSLRGFLPAVQALESRQLLALGDGLQAAYFATPDLTGTPVTRVDPAVDFNWGGGSPAVGIPADYFSARWDGQVQVPAGGTWTLYATADDGVRVWVDGQPVIDSWIPSSGDERAGSIALSGPGLHAIRMEYVEFAGGAQAHLAWSGPGTTKQVIPQANLAPEPSGILTVPGQVRAVATIPGNIELSWSAATGATGYVVERSGDGLPGWTAMAPTTSTSYTETGLAPGVTRHYRVTATAGAFTSPASAVASAVAQLISDPSFERPQVAPNGESYDMAGSAWVASSPSYYGDGAGVAGAGAYMAGANPPPPGGRQIGYIGGAGSFSQQVPGWAAGTYTLSFKAARSARGVTSDFLVLIDGALVGKFSPQSADYQPFTTVPFAVAAGPHTITFQGMSLGQDGRWALIDELALADVTAITPTPGLSAPPLVAIYPAGSRSIALGWFASHGATGYVVERSDNQETGWTPIAYPTTPSYTDSNLPVGSTWFYRVSATNGSVTTSPSLAGWATASLLGDPSFEMTPLALRGETNSPGPGVTPWTFSSQFWDSAGVSSLFNSYTQGNWLPPSGTQVAYVSNEGSLSQQVSGWAAGTYTLSFKAARAVNGNPNSPVQRIRVLVDGRSLGNFAIQNPAYQTYTTVPFAVAAGTHTISLVGLNAPDQGGIALIDQVSAADVTNATPNPGLPAPDGLKVQARESRGLGLTWAASYGATGYVVERSDNQETGWTTIATPTAPSYTDANLAVSSTWYYRVKATAGPQQSPLSSAASASASLLGDPGFEMAPLALGTSTSSASALAGTPWIFSNPDQTGEAGVSSNFAGPTNGNGLAPQGTQVAYILNSGSLGQQVSGWSAGSYTLSFKAARGINGNANRPALDVRVLVDGQAVGTFRVQDAAYRTYTTAPFEAGAGPHTIRLEGVHAGGEPAVALIDSVALAATQGVTVDLGTGLAGGLAYAGGFVSIPGPFQDAADAAIYLAAHPPTPSPTFSATFAPVSVQEGAYPLIPGVWVANDAAGSWIAPNTHGQASDSLAPFVNTADYRYPSTSAPQGYYYYTTTFTVAPGSHPRLVGGRWAGDNVGAAIFLNGSLQAPAGEIGGGFMTPFVLDDDDFVAGTNTLTFVLFNEGYEGGRISPTGLRVEGAIVTDAATAPTAAFIQGTAFDDLDGDGHLGKAEPYLPGATIKLYAGNGLVPIAQATTDSNGYYRFDSSNVASFAFQPGTYRVEQVAPAGYRGSGAQALAQLDSASVTGSNSILVTLLDPADLSLTFNDRFNSPVITYQANGTSAQSYAGNKGASLSRAGVPLRSLVTNCIDLFHSATLGDTFAVMPRAAGIGLARNAGRIGYLFNHYGMNPAAAAADAAGLQVALWELENDAVIDLTSGVFSVNGLDTTILAAAQALLAESVGKYEAAVFLDATLGGQPVPHDGRQGMLAAGSYNFANVRTSPFPGSLSGKVYADADDDGLVDPGEPGFAGVAIALTGVDALGNKVGATTLTRADGGYSFVGLAAGRYTLTKVGRDGAIDGRTAAGTLKGTAGVGVVSEIDVNGQAGTGYNFGEDRAPRFNSHAPVEVAAGNTYRYTPEAVDPDADTLRFTLLGGPSGANFDPITGTISWATTTANLAGHAISIQVDDGRGGRAVQAFVVRVVDTPNRPPIFTSLPVVDAYVGVAYAYQATAFDPDADPLAFLDASTSPIRPGGIGTAAGLLGWTPTGADLGPHDVLLRVSDGRGGVAEQAFTIVVHPPRGYHPPIIVSTPETEYRAPVQPAGSSLRTVIRDYADGTLVGTLPNGFSLDLQYRTGLVGNQLGPDRKPVYQGGPGVGGIGGAEMFHAFYHDIPGFNYRFDRTLTLDETSPGSGVYRYSDPTFFPIDGEGFNAGEPGHNLHFTLEAHSRFTYRGGETLSFEGDDDLWIFINGRLAIDLGGIHTPVSGSVSLDQVAQSFGMTVGGAYDFDLFYAERYPFGASFTMTTSLLFDYDVDPYAYDVDAISPEDAPIVYSLRTPYAGMAIDPGTGKLVLDPKAIDRGSYAITVRASDDLGGYDEQSYVLLINGGNFNLPPVFQTNPAPPKEVRIGDTYSYDVRAVDPEGDPVTYSLRNPTRGVHIDNRTGRLTWTPVQLELGQSRLVEVVASDGRDEAVYSFSIDVIVRLTNKPPVLQAIPLLVAPIPDPGDPAWTYQVVAIDPENDRLTYRMADAPRGAVIDRKTGLIAWRPTPDQAGYHEFFVGVTDDHGDYDVMSVLVLVLGSNHRPIITGTPGAAVAGQAYSSPLLATDPDGDSIQFYPQGIYPVGLSIQGNRLVWANPTIDPNKPGGYPLRLIAVDAKGAPSEPLDFVLRVDSSPSALPPLIDSTFRDRIQLGRTYLYQVRAHDPAGYPLSLTREEVLAGLTISGTTSYWNPAAPGGPRVESTAVVSWLPTALGTFQFHVYASNGLATDDQLVTVTVVAEAVNSGPSITTDVLPAATAGRPYRFALQGDDPDHDPLEWVLESPPDGAAIDPTTGILTWTPRSDQIDTHPIRVLVRDGQGGQARKTFSLAVRGTNLPPQFRPEVPPAPVVAISYSYQVQAYDPEGGPLRFLALTAAGGVPAGLSISPAGVITWTNPTAGTHTIYVTVEDDQGASARQGYTLVVAPAPPPTPPAFDVPSIPAHALIDTLYQFDVVTNNPGNHGVSLTLGGTPTGDMAITNGRFTWTPRAADFPNTPATIRVTLVATDDVTGVKGYLSFEVLVKAASQVQPGPAVMEITRQSTSPGATYTLAARAASAHEAPLTWSLAAVGQAALPAGLRIDPASGQIRWVGVTGPLGTINALVVATDPYGRTGSTALALDIIADTAAPTVRIVSDPASPVVVGTRVTFVVDASDNVGVVTRGLKVNGADVKLDARGAFTMEMTQPGPVILEAAATDAANLTGHASFELQVFAPSTSAPTAVLTSLLDPRTSTSTAFIDQVEITVPMDIRGTVGSGPSGSGPVSYTLVAIPVDGGPTRQLGSQGAVSLTDGVLGRFDPTILANGAYRIVLSVHDGTQGWSDERTIIVSGHLKLGNLHLSFVDLTVPVAGIPITITRSYDTLNAHRMGDFGYGWTLDEGDFQIRVSQPGGTLEPLNVHTPFRKGTRIVLSRPGMDPQGFTFDPQRRPSSLYTSSPYFQPWFFPDAGVTDKLMVQDQDVYLIPNPDGTFSGMDADLTPYNPADPLFGGTYTLETRQGLVYVLHADSGRLASVTDRAGNTLTYDHSGISSSTGRRITFERDALQRITAIIDPNEKRITYHYDEQTGDLISVDDRASSARPLAQRTPTRFFYKPGSPHFLDYIEDPLGRTAATTEYEGERLKRVVDASGKETKYTWDGVTGVQYVTDQLGRVTRIEVDGRGNVVRTDDPAGGIVINTYSDDKKDRLLTRTTVVGLVDSPGNAEHDDLKTTYTYDAATGDLLSTTDPRGNVTLHGYNQFGQLTATVNAGTSQIGTYDRYGLLRTFEGSDGTRTRFDYDERTGSLRSVFDGKNDSLLVSNTSNKFGDVVAVAPTGGRASDFAYDAVGNRIATWTFEGTGPDRVQVLDRTYFDDANRVRRTAHFILPVGHFVNDMTVATADIETFVKWSTSTEYDDNGQVTGQVDRDGGRSETTYDARGLAIQTRTRVAGQAAWLLTRTVYDAAGQATYATDAFVEGTAAPVFGTHTVYDAAGRAQRTERIKGLVIALESVSGASRSRLDSPGTLVSTTESHYNNAGRITSGRDENDLETRYTYNRFGEQIESRTRSYDKNGQAVWLVSRTVYDDHGRVILATDAYVEATGDVVYATRTDYDGEGRAHRSARMKGVTVELDGGQTVMGNTGSILWETRTIYDARGRVAGTIAADGQQTSYEYDASGRKTATIGPPVGPFGQTVRPRFETTYDAAGRVRTESSNIRQSMANGSIDYADVRTTTYDYDAEGRLRKTTFADGTTIEASYDGLGRKTGETNQLGLTRNFEHDAAGRLTAVILPEVDSPTQPGTRVRPRYEYGYDAQGNQILIRDPLEHETRFTFDATGNQLTRTLPLGFGPDGKQGTTDDAILPDGAFTESSVYDDRNRLIRQTSFEGVVTTFSYDPLTGRLAGKTLYPSAAAHDGNSPGETWSFAYDAFGRVVRTAQVRAGVTRQTLTDYDDEGRVIRIASPEGTVNHRYDRLGRLERTFAGSEAQPEADTKYTYDGSGRLETVITKKPSGEPFNATEADSAFHKTTYQYDLLGNLIWMKLPNRNIRTFDYDRMSRLKTLTEYRPDNTPEDLSNNPIVARYSYDLRADGTRDGVTERTYFDDTSSGTATEHRTTIDWEYDELGRLVDETIDHYLNNLDQAEHFLYDLAGNRLKRTVDIGRDGPATPDRTTRYEYDANDRLLAEQLDLNGDASAEQTTAYTYNRTQQATKTVSSGATTLSQTIFDYDLGGRMSVVTTTSFNGGSVSRRERTTYAYGDDGIRVSAKTEVSADGDMTFEAGELTDYLNAGINPTGYSQTLLETTTDLVNGQRTKSVFSSIGLDVIGQVVASNAAGQNPRTFILGYDGHGSTRYLTSIYGIIDSYNSARQVFDYEAYGDPLGFDATQAATTLLYSGEAFDARVGMQYLRARWYDTKTGRLNSLDQFRGDRKEPISLNKYIYAHANPIDYADPSGHFIGIAGGLIGLVGSVTIATYSRTIYDARVANVGVGILGRLLYLSARYGGTAVSAFGGPLLGSLYVTLRYGVSPIWNGIGSLPKTSENRPTQDWIDNVSKSLRSHVDSQPGLSPQQIAAGHAAADKIAKSYVNVVQSRAINIFGLEGSNQIMFGYGGAWPGWIGNLLDNNGERDCENWALEMKTSVTGFSGGWRMRTHFDTKKAGDPLLGLFIKHNFASVTFDPNHTGKAPVFILDPWARARPDIYDFDQFQKMWPITSEAFEEGKGG